MSLYGVRLFDELNGAVLSPLVHDLQWDHNPQHARCHTVMSLYFSNLAYGGAFRGTHHTAASPGEFCRCGFYANYTLQSMLTSANSSQCNSILQFSTLAVGVVEAYGKIVLHQRGFRSEYMRVLGFMDLVTCIKESRQKNLGILFGYPTVALDRTMYLDYNLDHTVKCARVIKGAKIFEEDAVIELLGRNQLDWNPDENDSPDQDWRKVVRAG